MTRMISGNIAVAFTGKERAAAAKHAQGSDNQGNRYLRSHVHRPVKKVRRNDVDTQGTALTRG